MTKQNNRVLSLMEIQDIELAERYSHGISKELMLRAAYTAREYHRLREALRGILDSVWHIDEATVPRAGIEAAPGQVVFEGSVGYLKIKAAREALKEGDE